MDLPREKRKRERKKRNKELERREPMRGEKNQVKRVERDSRGGTVSIKKMVAWTGEKE